MRGYLLDSLFTSIPIKASTCPPVSDTTLTPNNLVLLGSPQDLSQAPHPSVCPTPHWTQSPGFMAFTRLSVVRSSGEIQCPGITPDPLTQNCQVVPTRVKSEIPVPPSLPTVSFPSH